MADQRAHSPSSLSLAKQCRRAWALRYIDKIRKPEFSWYAVAAHDTWKASRPAPFPRRAYVAWSESEPVKPEGGQRGAAIGGEAHRFLSWYLTDADVRDADVYGPRRQIDWESLPGKVAHTMLEHIPARGSMRHDQVEREMRVTVNGVSFKCIADVLSGGVWDHKTTKDIRKWALLPHELAVELRQPERSLRDDLQACINALAYAEPNADDRGMLSAVDCRWTYSETDSSRRSLPVLQTIPVAHAYSVVERASHLARTLTYATSADAPPDTLRCDDYGGCWYRRAGHCTEPRRWGAVMRQLELEQEKKGTSMALSFKELKAAKEAAEAAASGAPAKAAAKPAKAAAKPAPIAAADVTEEEAPVAETLVEEAAPATDARYQALESARGKLQLAFGDFVSKLVAITGK